MLSLKTPSNFGLVLTLNFLEIKFFVCFIFILHTTQILALHKKWPYSELSWSLFSLIRSKYGEILRISPYSVRLRENKDQNNSKYGHFLRSVAVLDCCAQYGFAGFIGF